MWFEKKRPRELIRVTKQKPEQKQRVKAENVPAPPENAGEEAEPWGRVWGCGGALRMEPHKVSHLPLAGTVGHFRV